MDLPRGIGQLSVGSPPVFTDSKSLADYAAKIARQEGRALSQQKQLDGGWHLLISEAAALRRRRRRSK
jgi:hypothetical protein